LFGGYTVDVCAGPAEKFVTGKAAVCDDRLLNQIVYGNSGSVSLSFYPQCGPAVVLPGVRAIDIHSLEPGIIEELYQSDVESSRVFERQVRDALVGQRISSVSGVSRLVA
jgi:hypothetical protein